MYALLYPEIVFEFFHFSSLLPMLPLSLLLFKLGSPNSSSRDLASLSAFALWYVSSSVPCLVPIIPDSLVALSWVSHQCFFTLEIDRWITVLVSFGLLMAGILVLIFSDRLIGTSDTLYYQINESP